MTQMTDAPAPPPPRPPAPPMVRLHEDRVWLGVCGALGRATGTDPVLWRVILSVLTLFGGSGLLVYFAGWALIRDEHEPQSLVERVLGKRAGSLPLAAVFTLAVVGVTALLVSAVLGLGWDDGPGLAPVAVVALLAYLVLRHRGEAAPTTAAGSEEEVHLAAPPPRPTGPPVTLLTVSTALLVGAGLVGLAAADVDGITAPRVCAAVLAVLGIGLLLGARHGKQWTLISLALLTFGMLNVTARLDIPFDASAGERTWVVTGAETHRLGAGDATLDLRQLSTATDVDVIVRLGVGELEVIVPPGLRVALHAELGAGEIDYLGEDKVQDGTDLEADYVLGPETGAVVHVDVKAGLGHLVVSRG